LKHGATTQKTAIFVKVFPLNFNELFQLVKGKAVSLHAMEAHGGEEV
jgi:hypothetical protein